MFKQLRISFKIQFQYSTSLKHLNFLSPGSKLTSHKSLSVSMRKETFTVQIIKNSLSKRLLNIMFL